MDIIDQIKNILHSRLSENDSAYLFGSRARGDARKDSDWDILIVLSKNKVGTEDYDNISYPLRYLGWDTNQIINPIIYSAKDWEKQKITPFYKNVKNEAIALV